jgi:hypothetical protein
LTPERRVLQRLLMMDYVVNAIGPSVLKHGDARRFTVSVNFVHQEVQQQDARPLAYTTAATAG